MAIIPSMQTFLLFLFPFNFLIIYICIKRISSRSNIKENLPPSPWKLPLLGNFHQLGSIPHHSLQTLSLKHGPIMLIHLGTIPTLVASSAEVAREILKTHDLLFSNRPNFTIPNILLYGSKDIAFSRYGEYWRQLKSIAVIHLLSNARVKSFQQVRKEEVDLMVGILAESCGTPVDLSVLLVSLANNVICKATLGRTYHGLKFIKLLKKFLDMLSVFSIANYIPWLSWIDRVTGLNGRAKRIAEEFDEFLEDVVEEHVDKKRCSDGQSGEGQDLVDILLDVQKHNTIGFTFDRDTLKSVILDMFVAGTHTTFTSLEWTISELIKHPRVMKRLQQEVTEIAQGRSMIPEDLLEKMQYLKAVIKESLRLHTPAPLLVPRESTHDVKLMGYDIPARTQVMINAWAIGRDPTLWEEPEEFWPERFLNNSIDYKGIHFEWLPFGGGRRGCPGIQFGVTIIEHALANIIYKFDLALLNGVKNEDLDMSEICGITVCRKFPLMVIASPRF